MSHFVTKKPTNKLEPFHILGSPQIYEAAIPASQLQINPENVGRVMEYPMFATGTFLASQKSATVNNLTTPATTSSVGSFSPETGTNYCLRNAKSGLYLTIDDEGSCQQKSFTGEESQVWFFYKPSESNYFQLIPRTASTKRLTVISVDGIGLSAFSETPSAAQEWMVEAVTSRSTHRLLSRSSNHTQALCVDPNNTDAEGAAVIPYAYTDDTTTNDEWILEPFLAPIMEYDQGYFMYHSGYSGLMIQERLKEFMDEVAAILYSEFGLRCRPTQAVMIPSLADDCTSILYTCSHGSNSQCTNTYNSEDDYIHHLNWSKHVYWYINRGRRPNGLHVLWQGHPKCMWTTSSTGASQHTYFQVAENNYFASVANSPFALMNLPLTITTKQMVAFLLSGISAMFGANTASHNTNCVADHNCNTQTIYDQVLGPAPTLDSFWCSSCHQTILNNITRFSKSAP